MDARFAPVVAAEQQTFTLVRVSYTHGDADERRLARAIGADEAEYLAAPYLQVYAVKGANAPEALADSLI